ncbi:MAG: hypothetical protein LPK26_09185 [Bacillaceae bacterium]|uniref:Uncharacterized protein n=1 Tax=Alkalihalobacterium chitinilyticum TaxID=2980103 RepID=A0ABT5VMC1_9BACI|nr:hypothetical protein [Alkalihalobacterium chitinilyticum]MDE5415932.1 hypothetical protein [Alkalihalobacterium chitinilyticum]MEB1807459.1 hypothetical protein [Bacillaceae bacterium]
MKIGTKVRYNNKVYTIFWIYESGYCEIQEEDYFQVVLADQSELEVLPQNELN